MNGVDPNNREQEKGQPVTESVSVIIAVHNRFELLKNVVESILWQTHPVLEVILVDDGSTDGTAELLPKYIQDNPLWRERVRYEYQENQGQSVAGNRGIAMAKGEWLAFNGSDDLWLPQKLEYQFRALREHPDCGLCFTDAWFTNNPHMKMSLFNLTGRTTQEAHGVIDDASKYLSEVDPLVGLHPVWVQTILVRASIVRDISGFDPHLRYGEDDEFLFRLSGKTKFCFVGLPLVLIDRRPPEERHVGPSADWDKEAFRLRMSQYRFEKRLSTPQLSQEVYRSTRGKLSAIHSGWANLYLRQEQYAKAASSIRKAASYRITVGVLLKKMLTGIAPLVARAAVIRREGARTQRIKGIG